jgi:hypothetical protein
MNCPACWVGKEALVGIRCLTINTRENRVHVNQNKNVIFEEIPDHRSRSLSTHKSSWTDEKVLIGSVISSHCTSAPTVLSEQLNWHNFFTNMLISVHCEKKI